MISQAVSQLGRVDVLVNNAGIEKETPFLDKPERVRRGDRRKP